MTWQDRVRLEVAIGPFGSTSAAYGAWDVGLWDVGLWSGVEPAWETWPDCELVEATITRGRRTAVQAFPVGTLDLALRYAGADAPGDRWTWRSDLSVGDQIRVRAVDLEVGGTWPIFRGDVIEAFDIWDPRGGHGVGIRAVDPRARFAKVDLPEQSPVGAGESTGERMDRLADLIELPDILRRFDPGVETLQSTNLARNLAGEVDVTAASEGGDCWALADGRLAFRQRYWWRVDPRAQRPRVVWSNVDGYVDPDWPALPVACPVTIGTRLALVDLRNQITLARANGTAQTSTDTTSKDRYGLQTFQRSDLQNTSDAAVAVLADELLEQLSDRINTLDAIEVDPVAAPTAWPAVLDLELGDMHRLAWDDKDSTTTVDAHLQGVVHRITPAAWRVTLSLWERLGYAPAGGWDIGEWDVDDWS